jgi:uncharacterized protein (TIGR04141 family)
VTPWVSRPGPAPKGALPFGAENGDTSSVAASAKRRLRVLRLRRGATVDEALRHERLREVAPDAALGAGARVFIVDPDAPPRQPVWVPFLQEAVDEPLPEITTSLNGAVVTLGRGDRTWVLTFGTGHLFVNEDFADPRLGLRTVLNLVDVEQLRSVGSRVYEDVVVRTVKQVSRRTGRDAFTIDDTRDILRDVTGAPRSPATWGTELTGGIALSLTAPLEVSDLPALLDRIAVEHDRDTYKAAFGFVDFIEPVTDPALLKRLDADALSAVVGTKASDVYLAPPEPILYEDVGGFVFFRERVEDAHDELELQDYRRRIVDPARLSLQDLRSHLVRLVSASTGAEKRSWSIYRCLVYETTLDGRAYLLSEGDWFEIDQDFVARVDRDVSTIPGAHLSLPPAMAGEAEAAYNQRAAIETGYALLDRKLVQIGGTAIEVADLLTPSGELIHVKRKTQSATLSHLFSQGRISAEALKGDDQVRKATAVHLDSEGRVPGAILLEPFDPRTKTVVYAVIADNASELPAKLPFFSRLNLWQARRYLSATLDYQVAFVGVPYR